MMSTPSALSVRIYHIDHTMLEPGPFDYSNLPRVPVLRIYGASSIGKKACVHVHQVYPYFFVEYTGAINPSSVNNYITRLTLSLNHALAISFGRNSESRSSQYVRAILLVKGVHFYGFHSGYTPFLKIYLVDPVHIRRAVTHMQNGVVMKTRFFVYESHISFILQFMCDFGLYGCGWIELADAWRRGLDDNIANDEESQPSFKVSPHPVQSRMQLEVDVAAHQIINRTLLTSRELHHKLVVPAPPLSAEPLVLSVRELWDDERRRRQTSGLNPTPELPVDPSDNSRGAGGDWATEARWWDEVRKRIENERGQERRPPEKTWERWVPTTFESFDGLWEDEFKCGKPAEEAGIFSDSGKTVSDPFSTPFEESQKSLSGTDQPVEVDVDERLLSSQAMTQLVRKEEAEWETIIAGDAVLPEETIGGEEDTFSDDNEEGPIDEEVSSSNTPAASRSKNPLTGTPPMVNRYQVKRATPSRDDWANFSGYSSPSSRVPATPTKSIRTFKTSTPGKSRRMSTAKKPKNILPLLLPMTPADRLLLSATHKSLSSPSTQHSHSEEDIFGSTKNYGEVSTAHFVDNGASRPTKKRKVAFREVDQSVGSLPTSSWHNFSFSFSRTSQAAILASSSPKLQVEKSRVYVYMHIPPSASELVSTLEEFNVPAKLYQDPYYSVESDAPEHSSEYAGLLFFINGGTGLSTLKPWDEGPGFLSAQKARNASIKLDPTGIGGWEYANLPPSRREVARWSKTDAAGETKRNTKRNAESQIEGPTQHNIYGVKFTPTVTSNVTTREKQTMSLLSLEVFAPCRPGFVPDPARDEIAVVCYSVQGEDGSSGHQTSNLCWTGMVAVEGPQLDPRRLRDLELEIVPNELELLNRVVDIVIEIDPDIITGWETQSASWGYLSGRGKQYGCDLGELISRAPGRRHTAGTEEYNAIHTTTFSVIGRHVLNVWRIMRVEQTLENYTFENTAFHLLRQRFPRYTPATLTSWYLSPHPVLTARAVRYVASRTAMVLQILDVSETITKTAEFARVFGVDFYSVISRGSQFKVESFMFRIAKPESFLLLSPSKQDVGKQNAAECMPLIMEPQSDFYNSPLIVLDFQSLYPSIMIAYNYCYSTCLGRVIDFKGKNKFGVTELEQPPGLLETVQEHLNIAPNGIMYVKPEVRKGLLGRMLKELLETRVMVKQAMKGCKDDRALHQVLDARQLGLKYICNVTYGYTSATFSGRMPAVEIADSIVQSGRETLEKAIGVIESTQKWGAKVVYGDTDSLFIYLRGKTKEQAFRIGYEISENITAMNPSPIKLKFEKVYLPCVLMAKKRYVGFKYENPDDREPVFDAKGIETVRRDGTLAQRKMTETCLKILFRNQDLSKVKEYCYKSWFKILANKAPIQDFIFAKEVRLGTYSNKAPPPPGAVIAARMRTADVNNEPEYGDRVPYVITRGEPGSRLVDRAAAPEELLNDSRKTLDAVYYITHVLIPPLERIFNLVGVDVKAWYDEMPRPFRADQTEHGTTTLSPRKSREGSIAPLEDMAAIDDHFRSSQCLVCAGTSSGDLCDLCCLDAQKTITALFARVHRIEKRLQDTRAVCSSCAGLTETDPVECVSLDCPWLFARKKVERKADFAIQLRDLISELENGMLVAENDP